MIRRADPDLIVLMDVRMPGRDGLSATRELVAARPPPRALVLTTFDLDEYIDGAYRVPRCRVPSSRTRRPRSSSGPCPVRVAAGDAVLDPAVTERVIPAVHVTVGPTACSRRARFAELTERGRDALTLLARGQTNGEIAATLGVGEATAKTHVSHVLLKLGVRDRVQAVIAAYEAGFVPNDRLR